MGTKKQEAVQTKLHFATDDSVKKNGLFMVPSSRLTVLPGFNDRDDYGTAEEMDELAESIYQQGPRVPLRGYKDGENYVVIVGHRRQRAGEMIKKKYGVDVLFPMHMYPPGATTVDMLLDTLLTNSGKDLTPLEKAETVASLVREQAPLKDIAKALGGVSEVYVGNLHRLSQVPEKAKELIRKGTVSATLIMGHLKSKGNDLEAFLREIEEQAGVQEKAAKKAGKGDKEVRVTQADLAKGGKTASSLGMLKAYIKEAPGEFQDKGRQEAFEFIVGVLNNAAGPESIKTFFEGK